MSLVEYEVGQHLALFTFGTLNTGRPDTEFASM